MTFTLQHALNNHQIDYWTFKPVTDFYVKSHMFVTTSEWQESRSLVTWLVTGGLGYDSQPHALQHPYSQWTLNIYVHLHNVIYAIYS